MHPRLPLYSALRLRPVGRKESRVHPTHDVIVIGSGPAGATCSAILAQLGRRVLLLEREKFPRFHIGESLMPLTFGPMKRTGMIDKLRASNFVRKESVQFITDTGKLSQPFYFSQTHPHQSSQTWQVLRSEFDQLLMDTARENGVTVREQTHVADVLFDGPRAVGVRARFLDNAEQHDLFASVIVDASGTNAILSKKLGIRKPDPRLRKAAVFSHYRGGFRDSGRDEGATLVIHIRQRRGWFWSIPLANDITSVGVVADPEFLFAGRERNPEKILAEEIDLCPGIKPRLASATRVAPVHVLSDFTYSATQCAGDGWVLIGDAFGFLDPIYSSGVFLALDSGERAADAIHAALSSGDLSATALGAWGEQFYRGMQAMRKLVYAFYTDGFSFGDFMRHHPEARHDLVGLLIGDVHTPAVENVFRPMSALISLPEPLTLTPIPNLAPRNPHPASP